MAGGSYAEGEDAIFRAADAAIYDEIGEILRRGEMMLVEAA